MASPESYVPKDVAGRAAGNYRLAACAPQKHATRASGTIFPVPDHFATQRALIDAGEVLFHCRCQQ